MYEYFIVLDAHEPGGPKFDLMIGDPDRAVGFNLGSCGTIVPLVNCSQVEAGARVYRVYLQRTDGKTGKELLREGTPAPAVGFGSGSWDCRLGRPFA